MLTGMIQPATAVGAVMWVLSSLLGLSFVVSYVVWRSWQNANHTGRTMQVKPTGRQPVTSVTETDHAEEVHP